MSSSVFSETLQAITTTKLKELSKKRAIFEESKTALITASSLEQNQKERLQILLHGVKRCFDITTSPTTGDQVDWAGHTIARTGTPTELETWLKNLERFLEQARFDPTLSSTLLREWENTLTKRLDVQSRKFQYATLYGELVNEWLKAEKGSLDNASDTSDGFEKINRAERDESRANWEKMVFEPLETDALAIAEYLRALFGQGTGNQSSKALYALRKSVGDFEISLSTPGQFNDEVLRWTIKGLMASGLLSDEKLAVLKDFLASSVILAEVADVLNMRIAAISTWSWEGEVPVEQRRHVTGKYHVYIDEELLQAIFLQFVGVRWSVFFKEAFTNFSNYEGAWASLRTPLPNNNIGRKRREYFLGHQRKKPSIQSKRQGIYKSIFFMSQLPNSPYEGGTEIEGEEEAEYDARPNKRARSDGQNHALQDYQMQSMLLQQQNSKRLWMARQDQTMQQVQPAAFGAKMAIQHPALPKRKAATIMDSGPSYQSILTPYQDEEYDVEPDDKRPKSNMDTKQYLLHLLSTELLINTRLHGDFTVSRSEFNFWSPSLPHSTITSVLSFFGISKKWLGFFHTFLSAPLKFTEDGPTAEARARKRGVPGAHALSAVCGEAILFCMDYAVNQDTGGAQLYRMHDDFWLWSENHDTVVKGWQAITKFSDIMGVSLNEGKTGTVRITRDQNASSSSSNNPFRRSSSSDTEMVPTSPATIDPSLPRGEIRWGFLVMDPLSGSFLIDQAMVDQHITQLETQLTDKKSIFSWIQAWNTYAGTFFKSNFGKPANCFGREHVDMMLSTMTRIQTKIFQDSNVVEYLKSLLHERFGTEEIPDGYLYFPTSLGGLELQNPFIGLVQVRDDVTKTPSTLLDNFLIAEKEAYRKAKIAFDSGNVYRDDPNFIPTDGNTFFTFAEFSKYREEFAADWEGSLLAVFEQLMQRPEVEGLEGEEWNEALREVGADGDDDYLKWVAGLYGKEMKEMFGGLGVVDKGLLPMGMVGLFRSGRVKWQG